MKMIRLMPVNLSDKERGLRRCAKVEHVLEFLKEHMAIAKCYKKFSIICPASQYKHMISDEWMMHVVEFIDGSWKTREEELCFGSCTVMSAANCRVAVYCDSLAIDKDYLIRDGCLWRIERTSAKKATRVRNLHQLHDFSYPQHIDLRPYLGDPRALTFDDRDDAFGQIAEHQTLKDIHG